MEYRIEAHIVNWQNQFNGGYRHKCSKCDKSIYLNRTGEYRGICPHCGTDVSVSSGNIEERISMSDGGKVGVGRRKMHRKHLIIYIFWFVVSLVVGAFISGLWGFVVAVLFNILLIIVGFRTFTFEIEMEKF